MPKITIISTEQNKLALADGKPLTPYLTEHNDVVLPTGNCLSKGIECLILSSMKYDFFPSSTLVKEIREIEIKVTPA